MLINPNKSLKEHSVSKTVGSRSNAVKSFTKDDFLTKRSLAAKFKEDIDLIDKTLRYMAAHKVTFLINGHRSLVVSKETSSSSKPYRVHPMAIDVFKEYLEKQRESL